MDLTVKSFNELTLHELYEILKARADIFIMEQQINYQDMDDIDYKSMHFFFMENEKVIAYLRAFYPDDKQNTVKIGRVLTQNHGNGIGKRLMEESIIAVKNNMKCEKICMDAQEYAVGFYEKFGFKVTSDKFFEEGIVHVKMELTL